MSMTLVEAFPEGVIITVHMLLLADIQLKLITSKTDCYWNFVKNFSLRASQSGDCRTNSSSSLIMQRILTASSR